MNLFSLVLVYTEMHTTRRLSLFWTIFNYVFSNLMYVLPWKITVCVGLRFSSNESITQYNFINSFFFRLLYLAYWKKFTTLDKTAKPFFFPYLIIVFFYLVSGRDGGEWLEME